MTRVDADFLSEGTRCAAWHYPAGDTCVVMAHGFGGTRDAGLEPYAEQLSAAGFGVLLFDYRCLGASDGEPRQLITRARQLDDYRAAVAHARTLPGVERIVLWGASFAGGHVLTIAAEDHHIDAVISLVPFVDGTTLIRTVLQRDGAAAVTRTLKAAAADALAARRGGPPVYVPVAGTAAEGAVLTAPGSREAYEACAGPTWRNESTARELLNLARIRPIKDVEKSRCPILFQIGDLDQTVSPQAGLDAAWLATGRARVRHYPADHFDVFGDGAWTQQAAAHQVAFLEDVLSTAPRAA